jgi:multidrug efflux pump subunit AcrB
LYASTGDFYTSRKDFYSCTEVLYAYTEVLYASAKVIYTPLNVGSYTGLIMIVGIIGENAIFTFLQYREARQYKEVDDSIIYSISTRLRPKLMTALGAIIALMPMAYLSNF